MECVTLRTQHVTRVESTSNSPGGARARYAFIRDPFCFPDMRDIRNQLEDRTLPATWRELLEPWLASPMLDLDETTLRARMPAPVS